MPPNVQQNVLLLRKAARCEAQAIAKLKSFGGFKSELQTNPFRYVGRHVHAA